MYTIPRDEDPSLGYVLRHRGGMGVEGVQFLRECLWPLLACRGPVTIPGDDASPQDETPVHPHPMTPNLTGPFLAALAERRTRA